MAATDGRRIAAVVWDWQQPVQKLSNKPFYTRQVPTTPGRTVAFRLAHLAPGAYRVQVRRTGYRRNDPLSLYIDMGMPETFDAGQLARMRQATADAPEQDRAVRVGAAGTLSLDLPMRSNDVALVTLDPVAR
jgi:xylan 1,4-beta-xylosidase